MRGRGRLDLYPSDLMRPLIASRIDSSSSMIEISGFAFGTRPPAPGLVIVMMRRQSESPWAQGDIFTAFQEDKTNSRVRRLYFGLNRAAARANTCCIAPRSGSERCLGDPRCSTPRRSVHAGGWQSARRRHGTVDSSSFVEPRILRSPQVRDGRHPVSCGASIATSANDD